MKHYERSVGSQLTLRCPAVVRIDGRAFHTFTKPFKRPYDGVFRSLMVQTAQHLCRKISTARFAYGQSDEISILLIDYVRFETDQFFDGKVQKLASVIASEATNAFNQALYRIVEFPVPAIAELAQGLRTSLFQATFDARVFSIPERDTANYFVWRQQDCVRNAILSLGQAHFSHKQLQGKSTAEVRDMLKDVSPWEEQVDDFKYGFMLPFPQYANTPAFEFKDHSLFFDQLMTPMEE